jgi:2-phosphoglycerate kinase
MAKTQIIDAEEGTRVPFLRGILTRSLQETAGLSFKDAYGLASRVRDKLNDITRITNEDLRTLVADELLARFGEETRRRYMNPRGAQVPVVVRDEEGTPHPFSHDQHRHGLESAGLSAASARELTEKVYRHLARRGVSEIEADYLGRLTYHCIRQDFGADAAQRYLVWRELIHSGRPLVVLLGGTSGCGKSTIANELANRLDIVRTQSTDMLREVMRMMLPERLMPVLHQSSFRAWEVLPGADQPHLDMEARIAAGYLSQAELLAVPCEAVVQRAIRERVSLILEGVHIQPGLLERLPRDDEVIVVPIMLAVLKQEQLRRRFRGRASGAPKRRSRRYLENFDAIWALQALLLSEADRSHMSIVANDDKDTTLQEITRIIVDTVAQHLHPDLDSVFPRKRKGERK